MSRSHPEPSANDDRCNTDGYLEGALPYPHFTDEETEADLWLARQPGAGKEGTGQLPTPQRGNAAFAPRAWRGGW